MLSETVIIAGITAITGLAGAAIGAFASIRIAKNQTKAELSRSVLTKTFEVRCRAYANVFAADIEFQRNPTQSALSDLVSMVNRACVVASPRATIAMQNFLNVANSRNMDKLGAARAAMAVEMQADLRMFEAPTIVYDDTWERLRSSDKKDQRKNHKKPKNGVPLNG